MTLIFSDTESDEHRSHVESTLSEFEMKIAKEKTEKRTVPPRQFTV